MGAGGGRRAMTFQQTCTIAASPERLWDFLMDVPKVSRCLPGVERVAPVAGDAGNAGNAYEGVFRLRLGPISVGFEGRVTIEEEDRAAWRAALRADATDRRLGGGLRARARMTLAPAAAGATTMTVETECTLLGKIGEFGQPVIRKKADQLLQEFAANISRALAA
jgi:carbon monoxide dehydrogenase subunit G